MNDCSEIISLINTSDQMYGRARCCSEVRTKNNSGDSNGRVGYYLNFNFDKIDDKAKSRETLLKFLRGTPVSRSLSIDACFLNDEEVLDILREKNVLEIRILDSGFTITQEVLDKFSKDVLVIADNADVDDSNSYRVLTQEGLYKNEINYLGDDLVSAYFVDRELSDEEIERLVSVINDDSYTEKKHLSLRLYNPAKYKDFLSKLKEKGLNDFVEISILGNPLYDVSSSYVDLDGLCSNPISVIYDTCSDMIELYTREPFSVSNNYQSELEGGGRTSLDSYKNLLVTLEEQEKHIKEMNYSPLEAHIYAYRYLQENYGYDSDFDVTDKNNYLTNRQLDLVAGISKTVCAGYATLYSALMRRCGYPTFRYATEKHVRNITRIKDKKYGVDAIGVLDPTFDGSSYDKDGNFIENKNFSFFMVPPHYMTLWNGMPEFMTVPTAMIVDMPLIEQYFSKSPAQYTYDLDYIAFGYALTVLDRMGFNVPDGENVTEEDYREFIKKLNETTIFNEISLSVFVKAYSEVLLKENKNIDKKEILDELANARNTKLLKNKSFNINGEPRILRNISFDGQVRYDIDENGIAYSTGDLIDVKLYRKNVEKSVDIAELEKTTDSIKDSDRVMKPVKSEKVLVLDGNKNTALVPYVRPVTGIVSIDDKNKEIIIAEDSEVVELENVSEIIVENMAKIKVTDGDMPVTDTFVEEVVDAGLVEVEVSKGDMPVTDAFVEEVVDAGLVEVEVSKGDMPVTDTFVEEVVDAGLAEVEVSEGDMPVTDAFVEQVVDAGLAEVIVKNDEYIAGTLIKKPRCRGIDESDEEYQNYLEDYYSKYYPSAVVENSKSMSTYRLVKEQIIQDLPIYSQQISRYSDETLQFKKVK